MPERAGDHEAYIGTHPTNLRRRSQLLYLYRSVKKCPQLKRWQRLKDPRTVDLKVLHKPIKQTEMNKQKYFQTPLTRFESLGKKN